MACVLVTGCAGGIGLATATLLAQAGYSVVGMDAYIGEAAGAQLSQAGIQALEGDVTRAEDRQRLLDAALMAHGGVFALVNVAGIAPAVRADILEMTEASYDRVMDVNLKGMLLLTQLVARQMLQQADAPQGGLQGAIVNISSMSAYTSSTSRAEYCLSKAGVSMLTQLFADRLAAHGITVNEIRPGIIETGMTAVVKAKYDALIAGGLLPIARWGQPQDVAKAVLALTNGTFGYTTGQSIDVDGGFHIRRL